MKVLISDKLSDAGLKIFQEAPGLEIINQPGIGKDIEKLKTIIADVDAIAIRSGTNLTKDILICAKKLKVIGRAGIGVDNVDIEAASQQGIIVMNTPGGNTITTAEHAIAMMCALTRSIPQATESMRQGKWEKNKFMGSELYQKTLGVIGAGNIGKIVIDRAKGLRMKVIAFDPFLTTEIAKELGIEKVELTELYQRSDYITIHTPLNDKTRYLLNSDAFAQMKKGIYIINCARGGIIHEGDLAKAIEAKIVAGAALDVFEEEPVSPNHPLLKMEQVIFTPHLGAATEEAQENVALDVAKQIVDYLMTGTIINALNTPSLSGEVTEHLQPALELCQKIGKLHGQLCEESPQKIKIHYYGDITKYPSNPLTTAILKEILRPMLSVGFSINAVNAPYLAKDRGITIEESKTITHRNYSMLIKVELLFANSSKVIAGSIFGKNNPRIVRYDTINPEVVPEGIILIIENDDKPGIVGKIGTYLGNQNVNISRVQLGLDDATKKAIAFYNIEKDVDQSVMDGLAQFDGIRSVKKVSL